MNKDATIVIGADSFVGSRLVETLRARSHKVYGTTRRPETVGGERIFFDFTDIGNPDFPADAGRAIVVAGATDYGRCATQPQSHIINTVHTPRLVENLLRQGMYVVFVSSNSVFGGDRAWPAEDDPHDARFPYSIQKDLAEAGARRAATICNAEDRLAIARLTKVLARSSSPIPGWLKSWSEKQPVRPFSDLVFAPISRNFAAYALAVISERQKGGAFHISGSENINYVEFARAMADYLNIDPSLIEPTTAVEQGVEIPFKPRFSGLGMDRTRRVAGLVPQPAINVIADILNAAQGDD